MKSTAPPRSRRTRPANPFAAGLLASAFSGIAGISNPALRVVTSAKKRSIPQVLKMMEELKSRVEFVNPLGKKAELIEFFANIQEQVETESWLADRSAILMAASNGDREAVAMQAEIIRFTTSNLILATSQWMSFFEMQSLGDADVPYLESDIGQQIIVDSIGPDGGNTMVTAQFERDFYPIPLLTLATQWFEYPLTDLYKGSEAKTAALANIDIALDFADKINALLGSYLISGGTNTRLTATFDTSGANLANDYTVRANVNTANLPAGNLITLAGNTTSSPFRKEVFDAIEKYCQSWGANVFPDGDLAPVAIHVASANATDFLGQVTLGSYQNPVTTQIFSGGKITEYGGRNYLIIPDNTIAPNSGICYVRTNKPIGYVFDKPSQARTITDPDASLALQNKGRVAQSQVFGFGMPKHWRKNTLGVCYRTAS